MNKIVYNNCYGGFSLSEKAVLRYLDLKGIEVYPEKCCGFSMYWLSPPCGNPQSDGYRECFNDREIVRHDPALVQVVEELRGEANGTCANLQIYETESNQYMIEEYDGNETVVVSYDDCWTYIK